MRAAEGSFSPENVKQARSLHADVAKPVDARDLKTFFCAYPRISQRHSFVMKYNVLHGLMLEGR